MFIGHQRLDLGTCTDADLASDTFISLTFTDQKNGGAVKLLDCHSVETSLCAQSVLYAATYNIYAPMVPCPMLPWLVSSSWELGPKLLLLTSLLRFVLL